MSSIVGARTDGAPAAAMNDEIAEHLRGLQEQIGLLGGSLSRHEEELHSQIGTLFNALERIHDDDPRARRELRRLRASDAYGPAFSEPHPLVSVVIPTLDRAQQLVERSIPSALEQSHPNMEVIVVGDASPPEVGEAIDRFGDPRVRFHNLTIRGPYEETEWRSWLASGTPGFNTAVALARGLWIAPLGDDDAFEPDHVARLLTHAQSHRLEFVYDRISSTWPDGTKELLGEFPPRHAQFGLQASLYHAGLRFMELELGHALFGKPNDWGLVHRMMRAGVRIGMMAEVGVRYWPSARGLAGDRVSAPTPALSDLEGTRRLLAESHDRAAQLAARLEAQEREREITAMRAADLERQLSVVLASRSWRLTRPLRQARRRR
jgi:hypothetical protein